MSVERAPGVCSGHPILTGTRMPVHDIVSYAALYGGRMECVQEDFPYLSREQLQAAIDYYQECQEEIDAILRARQEDYEQGRQ